MYLQNLFQSAPSVTPDQVKTLIETKPAQEYCFLDVRQKMEHGQGRLPGSVLIPLGDLNARAGELDKKKKIIVYCRSGNRSVSATNFLRGIGFDKAVNMTGGIIQYNGLVASGPPEAAAVCFPGSLTATQLAATAWVLEEGTIDFIEKLCHNILNDHEPALFDEILEAKRAHQVTLSRVAHEIKGLPESSDFPAGEIDLPTESLMVGCVKVSAALQWAADKRMNDLLELMMTLSANAYDFYLRLGRVANSDEERRVFDVMANEEHQHLARLTKAYEKELSSN
jgi:rhodanese-related sulfurtransferase/rubrerythrin